MKKLLFLGILILLGGCSPKENEGTQVERKPSPTPTGKQFVILSDAEDLHLLFLKSYLNKLNPQPGKYFFKWVTPEDGDQDWDFALLRPWSLDRIDSQTIDLKPMLEEVYPRHSSDFFIPVSKLLEEEQLNALPITLIPHFLFAKNHPQWNFQFDPAIFNQEIEAGREIGLIQNPLTGYYRKRLGIPEEQVVSLDFSDPENPLVQGQLDLAIGPKGWLLEKQIQGLSVISLAELGVFEEVPNVGYHVALSAGSVEPDIGRILFNDLVTEGQLSLVGVADSFPIRRSVYSSPRSQGPLTAFYKKAFDQTLANLSPMLPTE